MLRKGKLSQRSGSQGTATTMSLTTATIGSQIDNESARSFEYLGGANTDNHSSTHPPIAGVCQEDDKSNASDDADDEDTFYEEEESMDDEREWRRDNLLLEMLQESPEDETEVYEEYSCRSSSPSVASSSSNHASLGNSSDSKSDDDDDDDGIVYVEEDNQSFLNPSGMSLRSSAFNQNNDEMLTKEVIVDKPVSSHRSSHRRPPVAVVFEIDDYTSDSGALGEESLLDFVRDFTEEMKDNSADGTATRSSRQSNDNIMTRPSVRIYSTLGARRCDRKTMKQRVLSSETILSTILENRAKHQKESRTIPEAEPEEEIVSLPSNDSTVEERPYHRRHFSKEMSTKEIVCSMRGEDVLLTTAPRTHRKMETKPQDVDSISQEVELRDGLASFWTSSIDTKSRVTNATNMSANEQRFATTLNEETERRRRRIRELRERREVDRPSAPTVTVPSINWQSYSASVHFDRSVRQQQTSLRPIMHNTAATTTLTQQAMRGHRAKSSFAPPSTTSNRPPTLPKKKECGLRRLLSKFSGDNTSKKKPRQAPARQMTAGAAYRAAVAARSRPKMNRPQPTLPRRANQAPVQTVIVHSIPSMGPNSHHQRPLAASMQPTRLFDDDSTSTCTSLFGRCPDNVAASTAKAAAAWV